MAVYWVESRNALEMSLSRGHALHRGVVRMQVGVVADDEGARGEGVGYLYAVC